jgi:hypothetical protein
MQRPGGHTWGKESDLDASECKLPARETILNMVEFGDHRSAPFAVRPGHEVSGDAKQSLRNILWEFRAIPHPSDASDPY